MTRSSWSECGQRAADQVIGRSSRWVSRQQTMVSQMQASPGLFTILGSASNGANN
jgi:hypothetical protein